MDHSVGLFHILVGIDAFVVKLLQRQELIGGFLIKGYEILIQAVGNYASDQGVDDLAVLVAFCTVLFVVSLRNIKKRWIV